VDDNIKYLNSLEQLRKNESHYLTKPQFYKFLKSLGQEDVIYKIIENLNSDNDRKAFINFIEQNGPRYLEKNSDGFEGYIYKYANKII